MPENLADQPAPSPLLDPILPNAAMDYLDRMAALCKERGIELILIKAPTNYFRYHWYDEWDEQIVSYAAEHSLAYYNLIPKADEMGLDMTTDTYDEGAHLNVYGAEKLSRYFGKILSDTHEIPDRRLYSYDSVVWKGRVDAYYARKAQMEQANSSP
jgi:hypothetical protein